MGIMKRIVSGFCLVALTVVAAYLLLPWRGWSEHWISDQLGKQGVEVSQLSLESIGINHVDFRNVQLSLLDAPLEIPLLRIYFTPATLFEKRVTHIEIRQLDYHYTAANTEQKSEQTPLILPAPTLLQQLPIEHISIADSQLRITADGINVTLPFEVDVKAGAAASISVSGQNADISLADQGSGRLKMLTINAVPQNDDGWQVDISGNGLTTSLIAPEQDTSQPAEKKNNATAIMLPDIPNLTLSTLAVQDISIDYSAQDMKLSTAFDVALSPDANTQLIIAGKSLSLHMEGDDIQLPTWEGTIIWPDRMLKIDTITLNKPVIALSAPPQSETSPPNSNQGVAPLDLPLPAQLAALPVGTIRIADADVSFTQEKLQWQGTMNGEAQISPQPSLTLKVNASQLTTESASGKKSYQLTGLSASLSPDKNHWKLTAGLNDFSLPPSDDKKQQVALPWLPLSVQINGHVFADHITAQAQASHQKFTAETSLDYNSRNPALNQTIVKVAGGSITIPKVALGQKDIAFTAQFLDVSLEEILQLVLQDEQSIQASGRLSGDLRVHLSAEGALDISDGELHNVTAGILSLGEQHLSGLPTNVEHVSQVAELLKRFEYDSLILTTRNEGDTLLVTAALQGRNPKVYEGAEVHLNINLRGDVIEALTSAIGIYELPTQYLKGTHNED